jgi:hypothetical protein
MNTPVAPHPTVAAIIANRISAGLSIRVTFSDGSPDFTGHYRSIAERDAKMSAVQCMPHFNSVEVITA